MITLYPSGIPKSIPTGTIRGLKGCHRYDANGIPKASLAATTAVLTTVGVQVIRTAVQSIPASTWTKVTWDSELRDSAAFHTGSSGDLVIPSAALAGDYEARACGFWAQNGTGQRGMRLTKNGAVISESIVPASLLSGGAGHPPLDADLWGLVAADIVALEVFQSTIGALNFGVAGSPRSSLTLKQTGVM